MNGIIEQAVKKAIDQNILVYDSNAKEGYLSKHLFDLIYTVYKNNFNKQGSKIKRIYLDSKESENVLIYDYETEKLPFNFDIVLVTKLLDMYDKLGGSCAPSDYNIVLVEFEDGGVMMGSY